MGVKRRRISVEIERVDLAAMPPGGERALRERIANELASLLAAGDGDRQTLGRNPLRAAGAQAAPHVHERVARQAFAAYAGPKKT